ncbi:hypothetical protein Ocin01_01144 [Orchesella cincta]|uniref:Uncharacterized protein n=1 Tax=Orchesella cincta TaxID=48709 RepID=A0A1D2NJX8_ORCCI|nr:hypothetical protein Ocin01_01144 [Orchesella cincta]
MVEEAFTSGSDAGDRQTIDILKRVIKEKVEKIRIQERIILSLNSKLVQNSKKPHYEFRHSFTQTETEKAFPDKRERKCEDDREVTMKLLLDKIDCLEERMNRVAAFLENQFSPNQRFLVDRVGKSSFPLKPWTKPPSIHPKPTSSSTKREDLTRSRFTRSNGNSVGNNETGIGSMHHHPGSSNGNDHDLELRVQFLESLVAQLKSRFMKVIQIQRNVQK